MDLRQVYENDFVHPPKGENSIGFNGTIHFLVIMRLVCGRTHPFSQITRRVTFNKIILQVYHSKIRSGILYSTISVVSCGGFSPILGQIDGSSFSSQHLTETMKQKTEKAEKGEKGVPIVWLKFACLNHFAEQMGVFVSLAV